MSIYSNVIKVGLGVIILVVGITFITNIFNKTPENFFTQSCTAIKGECRETCDDSEEKPYRLEGICSNKDQICCGGIKEIKTTCNTKHRQCSYERIGETLSCAEGQGYETQLIELNKYCNGGLCCQNLTVTN